MLGWIGVVGKQHAEGDLLPNKDGARRDMLPEGIICLRIYAKTKLILLDSLLQEIV